MEEHVMHYETLLTLTRAISMSREAEEVAVVAVEAVKSALKVKGCAIFIINRKTGNLELAAASGLSEEFLNKGPVNALQSIARSLKDGPIAIYDTADDPRLQYPEETRKEGIASILSVPIVTHGRTIGALRVYTALPWEFTMRDVNMVQAVAQMVGMAIDMCRLYKGYKHSIEVLKDLRRSEAA